MKGLIATIIILLITIFGLYIFNYNKDIFKKSSWPVELSQVPDISQFAKINSIKKEIVEEDTKWYIQIDNIKIKKIGEYRNLLKNYNFEYLNDEQINENYFEEHHVNKNINVFLKYTIKYQTSDLLITVIIK